MKTPWILFAALGVLGAATGCSKPAEKSESATPPAAAGQSPAAPPQEGPAVQPAGGMGGSPMGRGMAPPPKPADDAPLAPTPDEDKAIADAEKSGDKAAISKAYLERAVRHRIDTKAGDKVKFPAVLADLKKSLEADPNNERAKKVMEFVEGLIKETEAAKAAPKQ